MKTALIFISKHGTTEKVAQDIANKLGKEQTELINLKNNSSPNLEAYDRIILGGSIHVGAIQKKMRRFYEKNTDQLLSKKLGLFLCCMDKEKAQEEFDRAYPETLRNHSTSNEILGGEFRIDKMNSLERFMTKKIAGVTESVSEIREDKINKFVGALKKAIQ